MMEVKIEKGVPIPESRKSSPKGIIMTLKGMSFGDSFVYPGKSVSNIYLYARMGGIRVTCHALPDGKWRVWRIK